LKQEKAALPPEYCRERLKICRQSELDIRITSQDSQVFVIHIKEAKMSVLTQIFPKIPPRHGEEKAIAKLVATAKSMSEVFWFTTAFALFVIMGPFSAVAALVGVFTFAGGNKKTREPEAVGS
jgi:cobalamin synthase